MASFAAEMENWGTPTFERRETTIHDEFEIAKLALREKKSRKGLGFGRELGMPRKVASNEVLEDTAVRSVGHF